MDLQRHNEAATWPTHSLGGGQVYEHERHDQQPDRERDEFFQRVTDLHLNVTYPEKSVYYPGPVPLPASLADTRQVLLERCMEMRREARVQMADRTVELNDFTVSHRDVVWRVHYGTAIDGDWLRMRRMPPSAPHLGPNGLPSRLPQPIVRALMHPELRKGGLVYIVGPTGQGKTHTATATVSSRLREYGGIAFTYEDPPEHPLNGWHVGANGQRGLCSQHQVRPQPGDIDGWATAMKGALRSQPAGTPSIMFVGEIRTKAAAEVAMQAAGNGFLVIATGFASDVASGVNHLLTQLGPERANILAYLLRIVIFQVLMDQPRRAGEPESNSKVVQAQICVSPSSNSRVATIVASGQVTRLHDEVARQANHVRSGPDADIWALAGGS